MRLDIVTHCWNYSRLLSYQLSSLVLNPPTKIQVKMIVFYNKEDSKTVEVLEFFGRQKLENVSWHWWPLEQPLLLRRAIGRNMAALANEADWVWFTDCDQVFREHCLDSLPEQLEGKDSILVYPEFEHCTDLLEEDHPLFTLMQSGPRIADIDESLFTVQKRHERAIGPLQIVKGSVAREKGYCKDIPKFMKPPKRWKRTFEDVAFRKTLGTSGDPIHLPGLFRIEHKRKGRRKFFRRKVD